MVGVKYPQRQSLGNNDFESDVSKLSPFLSSLDFPILSSNVKIHSKEAENKIKKSVIVDINNTKVGIIGYLTLESNILDSAGNIEYNNEIISLEEEVDKLQAEGVKIIIALGHSDLDKNMEIAKEVIGLDLVISGHKNVYFWNGTSAEVDIAYAPLNIVKQESGKEVPIIQSYAYNQYLGKILVEFDNDGEIIGLGIDSILLDTSISQDEEASQLLNKYTEELKSTSEVVGTTAVVLDGESCRLEECNLGNLVVDSIIYYYAVRFEGERWTDASIAIIHGGAFASTIAPSNRPASVTRNDLLAAIPESDNLIAVTVNGTVLLELLEHSVADYRLSNPSGQFLQFSGIRVTYDLARDPGTRIVSAVARCWDCFVPEFYQIDNWRNYKILMPLSLANGANGYSMLVDSPREALAYDAIACTSEFISLRSPVYPDVAGRVTLLNTDAVPDSASTATSTLTVLCISTIIYIFL